MKLLIGIQARTNSKRFPKKIYQLIGDKPLLRWVYDAGLEAERRIRGTKTDVATAIIGPADDVELKTYCATHLLKFYSAVFAPEDDLIKRYLTVMGNEHFTHVIRLTADCWATSPELVCAAADLLKKADYVSNTIHRSFPEGLDIQACSYEALKWFDRHQKEHREHPFMEFDANEKVRIEFSKQFQYLDLIDKTNPLFVRTSIDTKEDLDRANLLYAQAQKYRQTMGRKGEERPSAEPSRDELEKVDSVR